MAGSCLQWLAGLSAWRERCEEPRIGTSCTLRRGGATPQRARCVVSSFVSVSLVRALRQRSSLVRAATANADRFKRRPCVFRIFLFSLLAGLFLLWPVLVFPGPPKRPRYSAYPADAEIGCSPFSPRLAVAPHDGLCSRFRAGTFVRAHGRHAVNFDRRLRALGRHRGAFESAVSRCCSGGPRHLEATLLAPHRGAPVVHAGRLGTERADCPMIRTPAPRI